MVVTLKWKSSLAFLVVLLSFTLSHFSFPVIAQSDDKIRIENELLDQARANIEQYRKGKAVLRFTDQSGKPLKGMKVEINQQSQDFLFGNLCEEVFDPRLSSEEARKFERYFTDLFNFTELTIIKWGRYEKSLGKLEWKTFQETLEWCTKNNITPKGHTIGWTNMSGTPRWLLKLPGDMATDLYKTRIYDLVGGFKDQVTMWDVVNEPVTTIPWENALADSVFGESKIDDGSRYNVKGISMEQTIPWVEQSYKWAYKANPRGDFILNEFYVIAKPEVRQKFYNLLSKLKARNTPVTGIGIQAHEPREMWFSPIEIVKTFNKFDSLKLPLHITEFIPQSSGKKITGGWREGTWTEEAQAEFAVQFYTLAFGHRSMRSIHWWGLSDRMIWLKNGGLLDKDLNPKPVYTRLHKLIKEDWMTKNVLMTTGKKGEVTFAGFYGNYSIRVTLANGAKHTLNFHLKEGSDNTVSYSF